MTSEQQQRNIEIVKQSFRAWSARDLDTLLAQLDEDCEWIQPGQSTISGIYRGKDQVYQLMTQLAAKNLTTDPMQFFAEGDAVAVQIEGKLDGEQTRGVQVFTLRNGKITRMETYGDTALTERVYGRRAGATAHSN